FAFLPFAALASAISCRYSCVAPVRGSTYFSLQRQRKVGKREPLLNLQCLPAYRCGTGPLSSRAATSAPRRKPALNLAQRQPRTARNPTTRSRAHTAAIT